mmetsp:Transcript_14885/g.38194  ORF Transcript_14885/g.38194 Transcript_14885/m.38194 type:complete len:415 (+) Transcript_14885:66-1310(+)
MCTRRRFGRGCDAVGRGWRHGVPMFRVERRGGRPPSRHRLQPVELARDDEPHDLVGALQDGVHAQVAQVALHVVLRQVAVAAQHLQRAVRDARAGVGGEALGHRGVQRGGGRARVQGGRRAAHQQPRRLHLRGHVHQAERRVLERADRLPELPPRLRVAARGVEAELRAAQAAGGDVDAPAVQCSHGHLEALPLLAQAVGQRDAHAVADDGGRGLRLPAHLLFVGAKAQPLRALLHDEGCDARGAGRPGARHDNVDIADAAGADKRLLAAEHVVVALPHGRHAQRGGVAAGAWLRQAVAGEAVHAHEARQQAGALLVAAKGVDHVADHVVDGEVCGHGDVAVRERLKHHRRVQAPHPAAAHVVPHVDAAKAQLRGGAQRVDGEVAGGVPGGGKGHEFLACKLSCHALNLDLVGG